MSLDGEWNDSGSGTFTDYAGASATGGQSVNPLLLDFIDYVLEDGDTFRNIRFAWIAYRTHRLKGLLRAIPEAEANLEKELADQREALTLKNVLDNIFG